MMKPAKSAALWDDLKQLIRNVVEEMNRLEEFRSKTGGLDYQLSETDSIVIIKPSLPSMTVNVDCRPNGLEVVKRIPGQGLATLEAQESLTVQIGEGGPSFRNKTGEALTVEEAVYYILRPFLHLNAAAASTAMYRRKA